MNPYAAALAAALAAAASGVLLARKRPEHAPAAVALVLLAGLPLAQLPLLAAMPLPAPLNGYQGAARALVAVDGALVLALAALPCGLAAVTCSSRPRRSIAVLAFAWLAAALALALAYPSPAVRGDALRRLYLGANLAADLGAAALLARWAVLRRRPTSAHVIALALLVLDVSTLVNPRGPWRMLGRWSPVQVGLVIGLGWIAAAQLALWGATRGEGRR